MGLSEAGSDPVVFPQWRRATTRRGGGGLVTALSGLAGRLDDAVWVCRALTDEDAD